MHSNFTNTLWPIRIMPFTPFLFELTYDLLFDIQKSSRNHRIFHLFVLYSLFHMQNLRIANTDLVYYHHHKNTDMRTEEKKCFLFFLF